MLGQMSLDQTTGASMKQRVRVHQISLKDARYTLERFHYLKRCRTGRQINFAILLDGVVDGVITYAYPMMSASLLGVPSDELVEFARMFLASNAPLEATCAISKTLRPLPRMWAQLFPEAKALRLAVSWSDTEYHDGTVYRAANFVWVRRTKGVPHGDYRHDKDCWVYPFNAKWREELRAQKSGGSA